MKYHKFANLFPITHGMHKDMAADIRQNGLNHPIVLFEEQILDGRNRFEACKLAGIEPTFIHFEGNADQALDLVWSENFHRRHLTSSQRAAVAVEMDGMISMLQEEAKQRQVAAGGDRKSEGYQESVVEFFPQPIQPEQTKTRTKLAEKAGTNSRYIQDAQKIRDTAPDLHEKVKAGELKVGDAKGLLKEEPERRQQILDRVKIGKAKNVKAAKNEIKKEEKQSDLKKYAEKKEPEKVKKRVNQDDVWLLGEHVLFCGDSKSDKFKNVIPGNAALSFADPPYNADVAEWDNNFNWQHDFLIDISDIVIVTPGIVSIFDFARNTKMPYLWSISAWISNGMTRGAVGFGNWIYAAIFSNGSIFKNAQDFVKISIKTSENDDTAHKGRKPSEFMHYIIDTFSDKKQVVIDPFAGSGQTLLMCEVMGRKCMTAEIDKDFCASIIERWENLTGKEGVKA